MIPYSAEKKNLNRALSIHVTQVFIATTSQFPRIPTWKLIYLTAHYWHYIQFHCRSSKVMITHFFNRRSNQHVRFFTWIWLIFFCWKKRAQGTRSIHVIRNFMKKKIHCQPICILWFHVVGDNDIEFIYVLFTVDHIAVQCNNRCKTGVSLIRRTVTRCWLKHVFFCSALLHSIYTELMIYVRFNWVIRRILEKWKWCRDVIDIHLRYIWAQNGNRPAC